MPNIFGKHYSEYSHLADIEAKYGKPGLIAHLRKRNLNFNNFEPNKGAKNLPKRASMQDALTDFAEGVTWFSSNLSAMQPEIDEILYSSFRLPNFFPMLTNIPEGAKSYFYRVVNKFGQGEFIDNLGTSAPTATMSASTVNYDIRRGGILAQWSDEDLRNAIFGGINLETETIRAATEGCMDHIEKVGVGTTTEDWFEGLINLSQVPITVAPTPWSSLSGDDLLQEITAPITTIIENTFEIFGRVINTDLAIYIPISLVDDLQKYRATNSDRTIFELAQTNNAWTKYTNRAIQFKYVQELETAGGSATRRVLYGYPDENRVWEMGMSISPRAVRTVTEKYGITVPFEYKISGLNVKRPTAMLYIDNV